MALNKTALKAQIKAALQNMLTKETNSVDDFADALANTIDAYVKTATVNVTVATTGSATAQTGAGTGNLS